MKNLLHLPTLEFLIHEIHDLKHFELDFQSNITTLGGVIPFDIDAYTCAHNLLIGRLFTLLKRLLSMVFYKIKENACFSIHLSIFENLGGDHFIIPYFIYNIREN